MTARVIAESYAHGQVSVDRTRRSDVTYVSLETWEGGADESTLLYLTPDEARELVDLINAELATTPDTRSPIVVVDDENAAATAAVLNAAREEPLASSTPVDPPRCATGVDHDNCPLHWPTTSTLIGPTGSPVTP